MIENKGSLWESASNQNKKVISPKMGAKDKRKPVSPNEKSFSDDL